MHCVDLGESFPLLRSLVQVFIFQFLSMSPFLNLLFETDSSSNAYLLAKIGVDTAENEPLEVLGENSIQYSLHSLLSFLGYLIRKLRLGSGEGSTNQPTLFSIHFCATSVKMFWNNCWYLDKYSSRLSPGRAIPLQRYSRRTGGTRTLWCFCISSTAKYPCRRFTSLGLAFLSCCG